jgi:hypothetical protein
MILKMSFSAYLVDPKVGGAAGGGPGGLRGNFAESLPPELLGSKGLLLFVVVVHAT